MDYAEEKGFGMSTLKSINKEFKLPLPSYSFKNPFLILTFPRNVEALNEIIGKESIMELNDVELVAFEIFRNQKHLSKLEFAQQNSLSFRSAERLLKKFSDLKLIKKRGSGKATDYIIIDWLSRQNLASLASKLSLFFKIASISPNSRQFGENDSIFPRYS